MEMLINLNRDKTEEDWDMEASGTIGNGLIKTINLNSNFFAQFLDSYYTVMVKLKGIKDIVFLPSIFKNGG